MDPTSRREQLVRLMRRGATLGIAELARTVGASRRTVLRDIGALRSRGFISGEGGRGGGVRLDPRSVLLSPQLTIDEVVALVLSVAAVRASPWMPFATPADAALAKIEGALPDDRVRELRHALTRILIGTPADPSALQTMGPVQPTLLGMFESAFSRGWLLQFEYSDRNGRRTHRTIEPQALLVRAPLWYVVGWDATNDAARLFRMDRVRDARVLEDRGFKPRPMSLVSGVCPDAKPLSPRSRDRRGRRTRRTA